MGGLFDIVLVTFAIINLIFGGLVYYHSSKDRVVLFYALISIFASLWSLATFSTKLVGLPKDLLIYAAQSHYILGNLAYLSFLWLAFNYPNKESTPKSRRTLYIFTFLNLFITALVLVPNFVVQNVSFTSELGIEFNRLGYQTFIISLTSVFALGLYYLLQKMRIYYAVRKQIFYLILANFVAGALGIYLNLILPLYGDFRFFYINPILVTMSLTGIGVYNIYKNKLFNLKIVLAELLTAGTWIIFIFEILNAESSSERILNSVILTLIVIFGVFLVRSVYREVEAREEIERLAKDLATANERLKELDKLKSEFVSIASHQLRSPLAAIKGYASLIIDGSFGKTTPGIKEAVEKIFHSSQSLVSMVEDFLNISRIEQGRMKYEFTNVDLKKLVEEIIGELKPSIEKSGLNVTFTTDKSEPYFVSADFGKIRQVINNLIDNGIKYTQKGSISITLSKKGKSGKLLLAFSDTGIGIDTVTLPQLFAKFSRSKDANKVNVIGTGLGLYIAKEIVNGHHGRIWAESEGRGKGTTFFVEFEEDLAKYHSDKVADFAKTM